MNLITDYFKRELSKIGVIEPEVSWSLGYCQSDGVVFEGDLDAKAWLQRILPKFLHCAIDVLDENATMSAKSQGMRIHSGFVDFEYNPIVDDAGTEPRILAMAVDVISDYDFKSELRATCKKLADDGYTLLEACQPDGFDEQEVLYTKTYGRFRFEVIGTAASDSYSPAQSWSSDDLENADIDSDYETLLNGSSKLLDLVAAVYLDGEYHSTFDQHLCCVHFDPRKDQGHVLKRIPHIREMITDLVGELRTAFQTKRAA